MGSGAAATLAPARDAPPAGHDGGVRAAETAEVELRRAHERFVTQLPWLDSRHSFSFGRHYDARNTGHGLLLVNNEDVVHPGAGYDPHPHRDVEILTWVLRGSLVHEDSAGRAGVARPGLVQRMSAGTGVVHSERNGSESEPVHFVQMCIAADEAGEPEYEQCDVSAALDSGVLVPVACGTRGQAGVVGVRLRNRSAVLHAAWLPPGATATLPEAPFLHLFVARGAVEVEDVGAVGPGDAVRLTATGGHRVTATAAAEVLVWEMHADPQG